jgi:Tol biopolymer transport system component
MHARARPLTKNGLANMQIRRNAIRITVFTLCLTSSWAQVTERVSIATSGAQGNGDSGNGFSPCISVSADGRYVAFYSLASNLVPGDTNGAHDVFVHDRQSKTIERVSVGSGGAQADGSSLGPSTSADGRFVAFESYATNLVPGDANGVVDVFVRDRQNGTTEFVSVDSNGIQGNDDSALASISADGRYVAFASFATNLVPGDTNDASDVFVHDRQTGTTERVSVDSGGLQGNNGSSYPSISADGRYVAFHSVASNLVAGDTNGSYDVFVHDRQSGLTERISVDSTGIQGNFSSSFPSISADGRCVAFTSVATNLVVGDTNFTDDVFVRDRQSGTTERVSVDSSAGQGNDSSRYPSISADARRIAFFSYASNLVPGDMNAHADVFVHDRQSGTTERASVGSGGAEGNNESQFPSISADGRYVAFVSRASNLVSDDTNNALDVFVRDRNATGFTSLCDPGVGGVTACPCSNPPSAPGRGCDNSAITGGAILSATGVAYLSMDSLVFTASGEKPTALSVFSQGSTLVSTGIVFGQGVRCASVNLKRLYTTSATGGVASAPSGSDPAVHTRSATLGDPIAPGTSRFYYVYYRDPIVLGGCPASSTFNATQTGQIAWSF